MSAAFSAIDPRLSLPNRLAQEMIRTTLPSNLFATGSQRVRCESGTASFFYNQ